MPKQYKKIGSKSILEISINSFIINNNNNDIYVTYNKLHEIYIKPIKKKNSTINFLLGGNNRQLSALKAIKFVKNKNKYKNIIIHDSVRPFVSSTLINQLIKELKNKSAVIPIVKVKDSIKLIKNDMVLKNIDRENVYFSQTPQGYNLVKLEKAYNQVNKKKLSNYTDDAQIFTEAGFKVSVIKGDENNFKITTKDDFLNASNKGYENMVTKIGQGIDVHRFTEGNKIKLFAIEIPFNKSIEAHSDGDVGIHALIDSLLGTLSTGDIGTHFPDTNKKYKNIDSIKLLKKTIRMVEKARGEIVHIDNTIVCEQPKVKKYVNIMRNKVSSALEINSNLISIKATTTEKLGFLGRNEGIAVFSIATVNYKNAN